MEVIAMKASSKSEEIIEYRTLLETKTVKVNSNNSQDTEILSKILKRLEEIEISYDDLSVILNKKINSIKNTKIGKTLKKLTKHKDQNVSKLADKLINKWKKVVQLKNSKLTVKEIERPKGNEKEKISLDKKNVIEKKDNSNLRAATPSLGINNLYMF